MTSISEQQLKANVDAALSRAQTERILISRRGKPCAVLVGIENYDAEDLRLATSEEFWQMIRQRRKSGRAYPLAEIEARLKKSSRECTGKNARTKSKGRNGR